MNGVLARFEYRDDVRDIVVYPEPEPVILESKHEQRLPLTVLHPARMDEGQSGVGSSITGKIFSLLTAKGSEDHPKSSFPS